MKKKFLIITGLSVVAVTTIAVTAITFANRPPQIAKLESPTQQIESVANNKKIFDEIRSEASYSEDPTIPSNLLKGINRHIVKIRVDNIGDAEFLPTTQYYNNPYNPCTPITIQITDNLYGDPIQPINNKIYISGGDIKISKLEESLDETDIERLGIDTLTESEKNEEYMRYSSEYSYTMETGKEYIVVVCDIGNGMYKIVDEGCGIFAVTNPTTRSVNGIVLKNVLTSVEVEQTKLVEDATELKVDNTVRNNTNTAK